MDKVERWFLVSAHIGQFFADCYKHNGTIRCIWVLAKVYSEQGNTIYMQYGGNRQQIDSVVPR
jgi:hypothetical protein